MGFLDKLNEALDPDRALQVAMDALIEAVGTRYALDRSPSVYKAGQAAQAACSPATSGTRNTGADVRVEEMIRQIRHVLGDDNLELTITTVEPSSSPRATSAP